MSELILAPKQGIIMSIDQSVLSRNLDISEMLKDYVAEVIEEFVSSGEFSKYIISNKGNNSIGSTFEYAMEENNDDERVKVLEELGKMCLWRLGTCPYETIAKDDSIGSLFERGYNAYKLAGETIADNKDEKKPILLESAKKYHNLFLIVRDFNTPDELREQYDAVAKAFEEWLMVKDHSLRIPSKKYGIN